MPYAADLPGFAGLNAKPSARTALIEAWNSRLGGLSIIDLEGDVYSDGWIGTNASFTVVAEPGTCRISIELYLAQQQGRRLVSITSRTRGESDRQHQLVISAGQLLSVSFGVGDDGMPVAFEFAVPSAMPIGTDARPLGVIISRIEGVGQQPVAAAPVPQELPGRGAESAPATSPGDSALLRKFALACSHNAVDLESYSAATGEKFSSVEDAFAHYRRGGSAASPELFPFIDPQYYAAQLSEPMPVNVTLFEHYATRGGPSGLRPIPLFDPEYVRQQLGKNHQWMDIFDYLADTDGASVDPHILFSRVYYCSLYPDLAKSGADPFVHFVRWGWEERRAIHPFFQAAEYRRFAFPLECDRITFNRLLAQALAYPGLAQQLLFDTEYYLRNLGPAGHGITAPLQHYLTGGWRQDVSPFPLFDPSHYRSQLSHPAGLRNPYIEYLSDFTHSYSPCAFYDVQFYLRSAKGASGYGGSSLLEHFVRRGAGQGMRPHRLAVVATTSPSRHSGFAAVASFANAAGRRFWLCLPKNRDSLIAAFDDIREIEPAVPDDYLERCELHRSSLPLTRHEGSLIALATRVARCNCLIVSETGLGAELTEKLFAPAAGLTSSARPWLTLLRRTPPCLWYWHISNGCEAEIEIALPADFCAAVEGIARIIVAGQPEKLVLRADELGIALLRDWGPQLLGAIPAVSLLFSGASLGAADAQWLSECVATGILDFSAILYEAADELIPPREICWDLLAKKPRLVHL